LQFVQSAIRPFLVFVAMTQVDFCPQAPAISAAPNETKGPEFSCAACAESFATSVDHRAHYKSERHVYNTKRKQAGLKPISQEAWERKLRESRGGHELKGTAHLKAKKESSKPVDVPGAFGRSRVPSGGDSQLTSEPSEGATEPEAPLTPRSCLFDRKHFETVELCLAYMERTHSFFIPDLEYCSDVPALLSFLGQKVSEPPHACINCNRRFPDLASVRRHMLDKGHTQLTAEARTRRGGYDEATTDEMQAELEPFYDFNSSVREVAEKINNPQQKVASILRFFDEDKDQKLGQHEVASLWAAANDGVELSQAQYEGACAMGNADPKEGLDLEGLRKLYADGFADLDAHFRILQDLLVKKHKKLKAVEEEDEGDEEDAEEEDGEDDGDDEEDGEDDGEEDEVVECDDEDEFEEVMRVLGLQKVNITATGDLQLPNGSIAAHRDVSYIYRQRGVRTDQVALQGSKRLQKRAQLMLSNSSAGCLKMAVSKRQEGREGKRIIAFLRTKHTKEMRLGITMNTVNRNPGKIRTGRGDCSNGR